MIRRAGLPVAAAVLAALLAAYPLLDGRAPAAPVAALATPRILVYVAGVLRLWPGGLPLAVTLLAMEYVAAVSLRGGGPDLTAPAYAAGLFACAELGWLSLETGSGHPPWPARGLAIAALAGAGFVFGLALLVVATLPLQGGLLLTAVGLLSTVTASAALAWLARASRSGERQF